ncbi:hypothetical protein MVEN_00576000 [Mycena venus]|uniref:Endonuclease/exonuclease/phosphatase domain-containing protein n=1 Tax=Mycena venus TaxID=2733690 RepID=A0A8H6YNK1_9AGAR|nr:hypothetical protein MVEN_00576000 [Mycena venus]
MPPKPSTSTQLPARVTANKVKLYYSDGQSGNRRWRPGPAPSASGSFQYADESFSLLSWNVDFAAPLVVRRFQTALSHLEELLSPHLVPPPPPTIILLQEVHTSCFQTLLKNEFIREFYQITNISSPQSYSTVTLVPNPLASLVSSVSRISFAEWTRMQRDCLYVDLDIPLPQKDGAEPKALRLRIANTHLESLNGFGDRARPKQLEVISDRLKASEVDGGLVAGDMNPISSSDENLPEQVGLTDAWLAASSQPGTKGVNEEEIEEASSGHTWGYQPKCGYPPRRLDKILTVGKMEAVDIKRIGVGLKLEDRDAWVSDHYGLLAKIILKS